MPAREGLPLGTIAVWGNVTLEPLDEDSLQRLAVTGEAHKGYLVDFENNFSVSAKHGLPVYHLSGGTGYVWIATFGGAEEAH
jgi:hypothetical protein